MDNSSTETIYQRRPPEGYWEREAQKGMNPYLATLLPRLVPPGARLLELGCESGRNCLPLAKLGYAVFGVDIYREALLFGARRAAGESLAVHFLHARAQELPLRDGSIDAVLFTRQFLSLFHQQSVRRGILSEAHRVLRPGGAALFSLQNRFADPGIAQFIYYLYARCFVYPWPSFRLEKFREVASRLRQIARSRLYLWMHREARESRDVFIPARISETVHPSVPIHLYRLRELMSDLSEAGFEPTGVWDRLELEQPVRGPKFLRALVRRGAPSLIVTARRVSP